MSALKVRAENKPIQEKALPSPSQSAIGNLDMCFMGVRFLRDLYRQLAKYCRIR
jgi:hypothetical protein